MVKSSSSDRSSKPTVGYYYAYMLSDVATGRHHYVGCTQDLAARLAKHNAGAVPHTSKFRLGTSTPLWPFAPKRRPSPLRPISKPIRVEPSPRGTSDSQSLRPVGLSASSIRKDCCDGLSLSTRGPKGSSIITLSLPSASSAPRPRRRAS